jgi:hypothetical protein
MLINGMEECNCPKKECERRALCDACVQYHEQKNALPFCKREVKE